MALTHSNLTHLLTRSKPALVAALLVTAAGWVGVRWSGDPRWVLVFDNLHWTSGYIAACLLATRAWAQRSSMERLIAGWIAAGMAAMTTGQMVWNVQVAMGWLPFPGPSDGFFMLTGILFGVGIWRSSTAELTASALRALRLDAMALLTGVLCFSLMLYLPSKGTYTALQLAVMVAYPVCFAFPPLMLLVLLLSLRSRMTVSALGLPLALLVFAALWGEWNRRFLQDQLIDGAWLNVGFSAVAILIGTATSVLRIQVRTDPWWDRRCEHIIRLTPIVMVVMASMGVVAMQLVGGFSEDVQGIGIAGALLTVALATIRQSYLLHDRDRALVAEKLVSEREKELEALNQELEARVQQRTSELTQSQKLAALGALVAGVSHELNTPIGNVRLVASTLREDVLTLRELQRTQTLRRSDLDTFSQRAMDASEMIEQGLDRATLLIQSFKQVAVDRTTEHRRTFDLSEVVEETIRVQRVVRKSSRSTIHSDVPHGITMDGYPGPLGQLLDILIENAFRHAFEPEQAGEIRISATLHGDHEVVFVVQDNGVGIPPAHMHRLFDPFFTTKMGQGGSGLGLHVAWNLVEGVLGGKIQAFSQPREGCRFEIRMPTQSP